MESIGLFKSLKIRTLSTDIAIDSVVPATASYALIFSQLTVIVILLYLRHVPALLFVPAFAVVTDVLYCTLEAVLFSLNSCGYCLLEIMSLTKNMIIRFVYSRPGGTVCPLQLPSRLRSCPPPLSYI